MAHCGVKDTGSGSSGEYSWVWGHHFLTETLSLPIACRFQCWMPQTKQLTGWEHSPTRQQTVCMKSSWAHRGPLNTPIHMILPTRGLPEQKWLHVWSFFDFWPLPDYCNWISTSSMNHCFVSCLQNVCALCLPAALCLCKCCLLHYLYPSSFIRWVVYHSTKCANRPPKKLLWLNILGEYITLIT